MPEKYDAVIIGAGPAGLTTAINLGLNGWKVMVVEKAAFPRSKVCGGFIGPENKALFAQWGILDDLMRCGAQRVSHICLGSAKGALVKIPILVDGKQDFALAVSRKQLDWTLLKKVRRVGVDICDQSTLSLVGEVTDVKTVKIYDRSSRKTCMIQTHHVINAAGASKSKDPDKKGMFGVAANFKDILDVQNNVYLYFADQAHLGINHFENGETNVCYVVDEQLFHAMEGDMQKIYLKIKQENPLLRKQLKSSRQMTHWEGTYFSKSKGYRFCEEGVFQVGDAVGMVNPVVGGGNSIAIASGMLLSGLMTPYNPQDMPVIDVSQRYEKLWRKHFLRRMEASWMLGGIAHNRVWSHYGVRLFQMSNKIFNQVFDGSHQTVMFDRVLSKI